MIGKLRTLHRALGTHETLLYLLMRALRVLSFGHLVMIRYHLVAQPVPSPVAPKCRPSARATVRAVAADDPVRKAFPRPDTVIEGRFRREHLCLVAEQNGQFSGFLWLAFGHYDEDEVRCCFRLADADHCAWDYDVHVEPDYRLGRTFMRLWDAANEVLAERDMQWTISRISAFNPDSRASHARLGTRHLKSATFLVAGPLQLSLIPDAPYVHLGLSEASAPSITLSPPPA